MNTNPPASATPANSVKPANQFMLKVYSPYKVYFNDYALSISAVNATGPFDILPRHHSFITLLVPCILTISAPQARKQIKISRGLMHVRSDRVTVFLDV